MTAAALSSAVRARFVTMVPSAMVPIAQSRITAHGQVSVPAEIRRRLGVGPGAVLAWDEHDGRIVVQRAGRYSSEEIHQALFPGGAPLARTLAALTEGRRRYVVRRRARRRSIAR